MPVSGPQRLTASPYLSYLLIFIIFQINILCILILLNPINIQQFMLKQAFPRTYMSADLLMHQRYVSL